MKIALRFLFVPLLALLLLVVPAQAVNLTLALTQVQVDVITWQWNTVDPSHTTWATAQLFAADKIGNLIGGWKQARAVNRASKFGIPSGYFCANIWSTLNTTQQNSACTSVNEPNSCTPCDANGN